jgi:hypothetical protein
VVLLATGCGSRTGLLSSTFDGSGAAEGGNEGGRAGFGSGGASSTGSGGALSGGDSAGGFASGGNSMAGFSVGGKSMGGFGGEGFAGKASGGLGSAGFAGNAIAGVSSGGFGGGGQPNGVGGAPDQPPVAAPRLLAPLSSAGVTSRRPTLRWLLAEGSDGAHVQICRDRACQDVAYERDASDSLRVDGDLEAGVYFWRAFGESGNVTGDEGSPTWQFTVPHLGASLDTSWGTTLDANGDGFADVIIGAPDSGTGGPLATPPGVGHAYFYTGSAAGLVEKPTTILVGPDGTKSLFGAVVSSAGDVNGDGFADVIVGAPGANANSGHAYVYLGSAEGLASTAATSLLGPGDQTAQFGNAVAGAGDVNGDGYADVIVGAPLHGFSLGYTVFQGQASIYFGSASGVSATPDITLSGPESVGSKFAKLVASAGDLNGDGFGDLLIAGDQYVSIGGSSYQASDTYYLYLGGTAGPSTTPTLELPDQNWMFTSVASGGDWNGDGYADMIAGAMGESSADVYFGGAAGIVAPPAAHLLAQYGSGSYNYRLTRAGDINGDGYQDLITSYDQVFVYSGGPGGVVDAPVSFVPPSAPSPGIYGFTINQIGDINRDGYDDVVIGNKSENSFTGGAYVHLGSANGLDPEPALVLPGPDGPGGSFG